MLSQAPKFEVFLESQENKEKEKQLIEKIAIYQTDRTNGMARKEALAGIKERTLILPREEYEKYIDEKYAYLSERERNLRKRMGGFSYTPDTRAVLNKDDISLVALPYVRIHEETEILEDGPFPEEKRKWEDAHDGEKHPQEYVDSHVEATYAEYRQAKRDGKLDSHHAHIIKSLRNIAEGDNSLQEILEQEERQRNRMYEEVRSENAGVETGGVREKYQEVFEIIKDVPIAEAREIVAMMYDLRPVAQIQADVDADEEKNLLQKLEVLTNAGFFIDKYEFPVDSHEADAKKSCNFFISKDKALAKEATELLATSELPPTKEFHNRFGQLMGFPQTAINAYIGRDCLSQEEKDTLGFPKDYENGPSIIPFGVSRKHYTEEVEYLKKYFKALIEVFPDTYGTTLSGETLDVYKKEVEDFLNKDFSSQPGT